MQSNRPESRLNFVDPAYADIPQIFHWLLNSIGAISLVAPYLGVLVPCFAVVWGTNQLQVVFASTAYGTVAALMVLIGIGATTWGIWMLVTIYSTRQEWEVVVRQIIYDACEECLQQWSR
jgi:hypothetical protein